MRVIGGPRVSYLTLLSYEEGENIFTERPELLHGWTEYSNQLLNEETPVIPFTLM